MKFNCNQNLLTKTLNTVSKAVTVRTTIPILKGILIKAENNQVTFSASDLDLSIEKTITADVSENGSIVVSAKLFSDIIRKLPNEEIFISIENENNVIVKTSNSVFTILGQPADEFPNTKEIETITSNLSFDKEIFKDMIRKTYFSASSDDSKGVIVGVLIELEENSFNMVALDGFRMAIAREQMINEKKESIIISSKTLGEILKILGESDEDEDIKISLSEKRAIINIDNTKISIRLIEGAFIKYKDIIPKDATTKVIIDRGELVNCIERASLLAKEGKNNLIKFTIRENVLTINSRSEEGAVEETIIVDKAGEDLEIGFNSKYLLDALKAIGDNEVLLELKTSVTPCLVKPIEGDSYEYLVLPVRISVN